MSFADNLIELRKLNNLSQEDIAEKIGVSRQTGFDCLGLTI